MRWTERTVQSVNVNWGSSENMWCCPSSYSSFLNQREFPPTPLEFIPLLSSNYIAYIQFNLDSGSADVFPHWKTKLMLEFWLQKQGWFRWLSTHQILLLIQVLGHHTLPVLLGNSLLFDHPPFLPATFNTNLGCYQRKPFNSCCGSPHQHVYSGRSVFPLTLVPSLLSLWLVALNLLH